MTGPQLDLQFARTYVRQSAASQDGHPIAEALKSLSVPLATHLAARPGRDLEAAADVLLDVGSSLGALLHRLGALDEPYAVILLNLMGVTALELDKIRAEATA